MPLFYVETAWILGLSQPHLAQHTYLTRCVPAQEHTLEAQVTPCKQNICLGGTAFVAVALTSTPMDRLRLLVETDI